VPTVLQISIVLGHGRSRGPGQKKEDDEWIRFHTLLTTGMGHGGQISSEKRAAALLLIARRPGRSRREGGAAAGVCRAKVRTPRTAAVR
jgi:hypothetical protein